MLSHSCRGTDVLTDAEKGTVVTAPRPHAMAKEPSRTNSIEPSSDDGTSGSNIERGASLSLVSLGRRPLRVGTDRADPPSRSQSSTSRSARCAASRASTRRARSASSRTSACARRPTRPRSTASSSPTSSRRRRRSASSSTRCARPSRSSSSGVQRSHPPCAATGVLQGHEGQVQPRRRFGQHRASSSRRLARPSSLPLTLAPLTDRPGPPHRCAAGGEDGRLRCASPSLGRRRARTGR